MTKKIFQTASVPEESLPAENLEQGSQPLDESSVAGNIPPIEIVQEEVADLRPVKRESRTPGSCINCGASANAAVQMIEPGRYQCQACKHEWTDADERAPFRQRKY